MKERSIIFDIESVRSILAGRKTQTRVAIQPQPKHPLRYNPDTKKWHEYIEDLPVSAAYPQDRWSTDVPCKWKIGNRLWVQEAFYNYVSGADSNICESVVFYKNTIPPDMPVEWENPMSMPRKYSRLTLEIVNVRCERLKEIFISLEDWRAEGFNSVVDFIETWDALNAKRGYDWDSNPWVWVLEFKKAEGGTHE